MAHAIQVLQAEKLSTQNWYDLQGLARTAFRQTLAGQRDHADVDALVGWSNRDAYAASHKDPNALVGERYSARQAYRNPRVAVATDAGEVLGFAYSANNVSGGRLERGLKQLGTKKNYLWLRETAVLPDHWREGIALGLGEALLKEAKPNQPVSAYVWPDEMPDVPIMLSQFGFTETGETTEAIFGDQAPSTRQVRMQAESVAAVLEQIDQYRNPPAAPTSGAPAP